MQDSKMNNLMLDMWKNIDDISTLKWMKDAALNQEIKTEQIGLQTLDFQKQAMNNIYKATILVQEQTEKMAEPLLKNIPGIPEGWSNMFKKNQEQIKKAVDESFVAAESYFSPDSEEKKSRSAKAGKQQGKSGVKRA